MELHKLAQDLGAKVSYHVPGGTPCGLSKEGIIMQTIEKRFSTAQTETNNNARNNGTDAGGSGEQQIITIHDKFQLINVLFSDEISLMAESSGNMAT